MGTVEHREKHRRGKRPQVPAKTTWPCATPVAGGEAPAGDGRPEAVAQRHWQAGADRPKPCGALRYIWILLIALTACNSAETGHNSVDSTLAALVPPDATMLAGLRIDAIRATPLYQKMVARKQIDRLDEFAHQTGFDPRRDVRELLIASNGKNIIVAARGTFNVGAFEGMTRSTYKGSTLYTRDRRGVALIDNSTAIAGTLEAVRAALDRRGSGDRSGPADLLARARQIPPENQVWSVSNGFDNLLTGSIPDDSNIANGARILRSLENTTAAADLRAGLNGYVNGQCRTDADAKNLGDAVRGLVGLGRLSVPEKQPELLRLWDGIKVDQQQRTVKITVTIPPDLIDKLIDLMGTGPRLHGLPVASR
jgi:hypothetical protein